MMALLLRIDALKVDFCDFWFIPRQLDMWTDLRDAIVSAVTQRELHPFFLEESAARAECHGPPDLALHLAPLRRPAEPGAGHRRDGAVARLAPVRAAALVVAGDEAWAREQHDGAVRQLVRLLGAHAPHLLAVTLSAVIGEDTWLCLRLAANSQRLTFPAAQFLDKASCQPRARGFPVYR